MESKQDAKCIEEVVEKPQKKGKKAVKGAIKKTSKPRRPFKKLEEEVLETRLGALKKRMDIASAQLTILTGRWQKYEDERVFRLSDE